MNPHFKKRGIFILVLVGLAILSLILAVCFFYYDLKPVNAAANLNLKISKGQGLKEVAANLSQNNLIKSITVFKLYVVLIGKAQNLKPGIYQLNGQMSVPEMVNLFIQDNNGEINVKIPDGKTLKEIGQILSSAQILDPDSLVDFDLKNSGLAENFPFLKEVDNLEGFLYPDTYRFRIDFSAKETIEKILSNFQEKIWPLISQKDNWYEVLILSSILEKEVITFEDKQLVAGILEKRIKNNFPLQVDAAPVTYSKLGWPSAPIANMGMTTIQAALAPQKSNYWYYLSDPKTKETIFSKTFDEHIKNKNKYLK